MQLDNELLFWNEQDNVTVLDILDNMAIPGRVDLCAAAKKGSIKILTWLLRDGRVDPQGCLDLAIREGRDEAVRLLLLDPRVDIDGVLGGRTPLMLACRARHEDRISSYVKIVEMLLANNRLNTDRIQGCMYQVCIGQDNADIIDLLLRDGRIDPTSNRTRVLIDAVSAGKFNIVARLLQDPRVDPNARRGEPLRQACLSGYTNIVKLLLSDPRTDPTIDDYCALITSAGIGREAETKLLLADKRVLDSMKHQELDERLTYDNAHPYLTLLVRDALGL
ncbi:Hypothetical protein POVR2_LOCUS285 [uncultured virus]|nr:Hypothetical protein POVR2_LOCUS285 [uncultured virus]